MNPLRQAVITGGAGDLARDIKQVLEARGDVKVHAPGRDELDVTCVRSVQGFFASLDSVDLLINNAGVTRDSAFLKSTETDWDTVFQTNLKGAFLCSREVMAKMLRQRSGHIINIGSFSAIHPPIGQTNYAAAKAGLLGLTKSLALEVGKRGICVNCILPGFLETKMTNNISDAARSAALQRHALGKFNTGAEVGRFISWLCDCDTISGQTFQLDSRVN